MAKYIEFSISRDDLPQAHPEFPLRQVGLDEKDFDLRNAKVWADDASVEVTVREKDRLVVKVPLASGKPRTIAVTTQNGKLIGILEGDKIPVGKET
ncbi:MAG TPA: hypothetical protein VGL12_04395 [Roseiarcus sp.]|jgi:hypothetical protein